MCPQPAIVHSVEGKIRIPNNTYYPVKVARHAHIGSIYTTVKPYDQLEPRQLSQIANVKSSNQPTSTDAHPTPVDNT